MLSRGMLRQLRDFVAPASRNGLQSDLTRSRQLRGHSWTDLAQKETSPLVIKGHPTHPSLEQASADMVQPGQKVVFCEQTCAMEQSC